MKYSPVIRICVVMFFTVVVSMFASDAGNWTHLLDFSSLASFLDMDSFAASE